MKKRFTLLLSLLFISVGLTAQIIGTKYIPSEQYPDLSVAADSLNTYGVAEGGVVFILAGNSVFEHDETILFTATGTQDAPIIFEWDGVGDRPVLNFSGTAADKESALVFVGSDHITIDGLDIRNPDGLLEIGITFVNASATDGCHYNFVKNTYITLDKTNSNETIGVLVNAQETPSSIEGALNNNQFLDNTISNVAFGYYFEGNTSDVGLMSYGNLVGSTDNGLSLIDDIIFCGVYFRNQNGGTVRGTTISNMVRIGDGNTAPAAISTTSGNPSAPLTEPFYIFDNHIVDAHSGFTSIFGMYINARKSVHYINNNVLHNITATGGTNNTAAGIMIFATDVQAYIFNNMISGIAAPSSELATAPVTKGIEVRTFGAAFIYHNSIRIEYDALSTVHHSAAFHLNNSASPVDLKNNIFVNLANPAPDGTGYITAFFKSTNNFNNMTDGSDNNIYYAGNPDSSHLLFYGHNASAPLIAQTLEEYQLAAENFDQNSFSENIPFIGPGNLYVDPLVNTVVRDNGQFIEDPILIDFDIDYFERNPDHPDIGAQELPDTQLLLPQNPFPEHAAEEVPINLTHFGWEYVNQPNTLEPVGFHLFLATNEDFSDLIELSEPWTPYESGQEDFIFSLPETPLLNYETTYYWKVIPSLDPEEVPENPEVDIWMFSTGVETFDYPLAAINPAPADGAEDVHAELSELSWEYEHNPIYAKPAGFHVYMGQTETLVEEELIGWVDYIEEKSVYTFVFSDNGDLLPYESDWYWKIIPAVDAEHGPFAPDVVVWSFTVESDPYVGISEQEINFPVFFPNPVQDHLNVNIKESGLLRIFDITGKKLLEITVEPGLKILEIKDFPKGILLIQLISNSETITRKISHR